MHIVTVNDYLARRDAEQFRPVYNALGLTVGVVEHGQQPQDRQRAYACDVTYCTNKELVSTTCEIASHWALAVGARACWSTSYSRPG